LGEARQNENLIGELKLLDSESDRID